MSEPRGLDHEKGADNIKRKDVVSGHEVPRVGAEWEMDRSEFSKCNIGPIVGE